MGLEIVELVTSVEKAFDLNISDADMERVRTPRELADYLERRLQGVDVVGTKKLWSRPEIEDVVEGLILAVWPKAVFDRDTDFTTIFP